MAQTGNLPSGAPEDHGYQTLGWGALQWMVTHLLQPNGPDAGKAFRPTAEQARLIVWFYALDKNGRFLYQRAVYRRLKGSGKGPLGAAIALFELLGKCRFSHFVNGRPVTVGCPDALIHIGAVRQDQGADTVLRYVKLMVGDRNEIDGTEITVGAERVLAGKLGIRKIEVVTTAMEGLEGKPSTFCLLDEPHHLTKSNGGIALAQVMKRNTAKMRGHVLLITNAHAPEENSVAELEYEAMLDIRAGKSRDRMLYDCVEAPPVANLADLDELFAAVTEAIGDSHWLDAETLVSAFLDTTVPVEQSIRFYLNQIAASSDSWVTPQAVDAAAEAGAAVEVKRDALIALGFDGSFSDDATALVGCDINTGHVFVIKAWEKPEGPAGESWEVPREDVDGTVDWAHTEYDVCAFFGDVHPFESYIDSWAERYRDGYVAKASGKHAIGFDMRSRQPDFTRGAESVAAGLNDGTFTLGALEPRYLEAAKRHFKNARAGRNATGTSLYKASRESPKKIDIAVCAVIARIARRAAIEAGVLKKRRRRAGGYRAGGFE